MKCYNYESKKIGTVMIEIGVNSVSIHTNRLIFKSLNQDPPATLIANYSALLGNQENVKLLNDGRVWSLEKVQRMIDLKTDAWNNGDPLSMFSVYENDTGHFIGSITVKKELEAYQATGVGHANVIEIGFIIDQKFWGKG